MSSLPTKGRVGFPQDERIDIALIVSSSLSCIAIVLMLLMYTRSVCWQTCFWVVLAVLAACSDALGCIAHACPVCNTLT